MYNKVFCIKQSPDIETITYIIKHLVKISHSMFNFHTKSIHQLAYRLLLSIILSSVLTIAICNDTCMLMPNRETPQEKLLQLKLSITFKPPYTICLLGRYLPPASRWHNCTHSSELVLLTTLYVWAGTISTQEWLCG